MVLNKWMSNVTLFGWCVCSLDNDFLFNFLTICWIVSYLPSLCPASFWSLSFTWYSDTDTDNVLSSIWIQWLYLVSWHNNTDNVLFSIWVSIFGLVGSRSIPPDAHNSSMGRELIHFWAAISVRFLQPCLNDAV